MLSVPSRSEVELKRLALPDSPNALSKLNSDFVSESEKHATQTITVTIPQRIQLLRFLDKYARDVHMTHHESSSASSSSNINIHGRDDDDEEEFDPRETPHKRRKTLDAVEINGLKEEQPTPVPVRDHVTLILDADELPAKKNNSASKSSTRSSGSRHVVSANTHIVEQTLIIQREVYDLSEACHTLRQCISLKKFHSDGIDELTDLLSKVERETVSFLESFHKYHNARGDMLVKQAEHPLIADFAEAIKRLDFTQSVHLKMIIQDCILAYNTILQNCKSLLEIKKDGKLGMK